MGFLFSCRHATAILCRAAGDLRSAPEPTINPHGESPLVTRNGVGPAMHRRTLVARNVARGSHGIFRAFVIRLSDK